MSSFQLVNTLTPLMTGALINRYSAPKIGLLATGSVLLGQGIVVLAQSRVTEGEDAVGGMIIGLFCFGLGLSPIAIVQESIILRSNGSKSKTVARSVAVGLLFGKTAAFVAACVAEPLAAVSPRLPFVAAFCMALLSFSACVAYNILERRAPPFAQEDTEKSEYDQAHNHKRLDLMGSAAYGTPFWL